MNIALLAAELERDEGIRLKPYRDTTGHLTIGIGRNLDDVGISEVEAHALLYNDIGRAVADLDRALPWWTTLDEDRQRVIANLAFNLGIQKLLSFQVTLGCLYRQDYEGAADAMSQSLWAKQVGPRADRLIKRMRGSGSIT